MKFRVNRLLTLRYVLAAVIAGALTGPRPAQAQVDLIVTAGDVIAQAGEQNTVIPIFLDNFSDTVAGVEIWIRLGRPGVAVFQTNTSTVIDTTLWNCNAGVFPSCTDSSQVFDTLLFWRCVPEGAFPACTDSIQVIDSVLGIDWFTTATYDFLHTALKQVTTGNFSTSGTLMDGWDFVNSSPLGNGDLDIKISALADEAGGPVVPGIGQQTGGVLINLLADIILPDEDTNRTLFIEIVALPLDNFSFSDPDGNTIGITTFVDTVIDTSYFLCIQKVFVDPDTICVEYVEKDTPPFDSISIDTITQLRGVLDTTKVLHFNGTLTVLLPPDCLCGDANGDTKVNIADITYLIARIFNFGPAPVCGVQVTNFSGDANGDCKVNIADITFLIARIFNFGTAPGGCCAP
ncbi:MAG: hypothetical protein IH914_00670 [candidate division Zixibacteria bacterium]|nr:hypothetical protein [candidate division Zixibacteria bacterium]